MLIKHLINRVAPAYTERVAFVETRWWHQLRCDNAQRRAWGTRVQFIDEDGFTELYERTGAQFNRMEAWDHE